jgi:hypothetical protein
MYAQAINKNLPTYQAPFNRFFHMRQLLGPEFTEVVAPNNDTLYSIAWLDLGIEPLILHLPEYVGKRYYVLQLVDIYTHNIEYIGTRTTGFGAGNFIIAGPDWDGEIPAGIDSVRRSEGRFVLLLGRSATTGKEDVPNVTALQDQFKLTPLSEHLGQPAPDPVPLPEFPPYISEKAASIEAFNYLNMLLGELKPHPSETALLEKFAKIGIQPGQPFNPDDLNLEVRQAVGEGVAAGLEKINQEHLIVGRNVNNWTMIGEGFGYRSMMQGKYLLRAAAGMAGLYGNNPEEAYNFSGVKDGDGNPMDASRHNYIIHFETPPPVKAFWSVSMYKLPEILFFDNPINRYSIGDRTPGFTPNEDGSVTIYLQYESPSVDKESNWLPAPNGPFALALRMYWPEQDALEGLWTPPPILRVE